MIIKIERKNLYTYTFLRLFGAKSVVKSQFFGVKSVVKSQFFGVIFVLMWHISQIYNEK